MRSSDGEFVPTNNVTSSVCKGTPYSFQELKSLNISGAQLFDWSTPVDIINDYEQYLMSSLDSDSTRMYCNCTDQRYFGTRCQYTFRAEHGAFREIIDKQFSMKYLRNYSDVFEADMTCYSRIQCNSTLVCLDWRQICNGLYDCDDGSDEENCFALEMNECDDETQFRCRNGMCIPKSFSFDLVFDCADHSDEQILDSWFDNCYRNPLVECEEYNCGWLKYSCGDGQCINTFTGICGSGRDVPIYRNWLQVKNDSSEQTIKCWKYMLCQMKSIHWYNYSKQDCIQWCLNPEGNCASHLSRLCNDTIFFPPNSVLYPSVHFLYKTNKSDWDLDKLPDYICFNETMCGTYSGTFFIDGLVCNRTKDFIVYYVDGWSDLIDQLQLIFSACSQPSEKCSPNMFLCDISNKCVSKHRIQDGFTDCYFQIDERYSGECLVNSSNRFTCLYSGQCILRRYLRDDLYHCEDRSDEHYEGLCRAVDSTGCRYLQGVYQPPIGISFHEICNGIHLSNRFHIDNDTDETNCEQWPCETAYTRCDYVWNCPNGLDELDCGTETIQGIITYHVAKCETNEHYCLRINDTSMSCLPLAQANDKIIDCAGASDERGNYCVDEIEKYKCLNSRKCVDTAKALCDGYNDCPNEDDEDLCPWRKHSNCLRNEFACKNKCIPSRWRCDNEIHCLPEGEDEWLCDLANILNSKTIYDNSITYPSGLTDNRQSVSLVQTKLLSSNFGQLPPDQLAFYCHRGILIQTNEYPYRQCLCPASYYGDRCEYQSERIVVFLEVKTPISLPRLTVFRLFIYLVDKSDTLIGFEEIVHMPFLESATKHIFYLLPSLPNAGDYFVRIDAYSVSDSEVKFSASWYFDVQFSFLPVNRLTIDLFINKIKPPNACSNCSFHGLCVTYENFPKSFCLCEKDWKSPQCNEMINSETTMCNKGAKYVQSFNVSKCVCPLGKAGSNCYASFNPCQHAPCKHNGTCIPFDQRTIHFRCICINGYFGDQCQNYSSRLGIIVNDVLYDDSYQKKMPALIVHFVATSIELFGIADRVKYVLFKSVPFSTRLEILDETSETLPTFAFVQLFPNASHANGLYYLVLSLGWKSIRSVSTNLISDNYCPNVRELLNETVLLYPMLKRVKFYNRICNGTRPICFYDETYMCFCTTIVDRPDCIIFDHLSTSCTDGSYFCQNNGLCIQALQKRRGRPLCNISESREVLKEAMFIPTN
ncbi:unnamed protein product [Didymodactylos carnosus]|uniref:EGF-like domain-containing protein n=1 Tax=Didymodactylos carnosus TaxID=1234261 RepID=A0A814MK49_9BILA|nr:unnamed protein product [Didymodactylos carnosus]CAF1080572.1 unnamed protein product [Didymodactylos carnosus]CAF3667162.1 unnamed protein product [Didymodactylos carnosus]CAF3846529.1 unnamed protein product [Didymodactylos carnosus]